MPEPRRTARVLGVASAALLAALLSLPAAIAQTPTTEPLDPDEESPQPEEPGPPEPGTWDGSRIAEPVDGAQLRRSDFDVFGTMQYGKEGPADRIDSIEVRVVDDDSDDFEPHDDCPLPPATAATITAERDDLASVREFERTDVSVPCNGRYLVEVEAELEDPQGRSSHTITATVTIAAAPAAVTGLGVTLDGDERSVTASFQPLAEADLAPDAIGYVLERSGPDGGTFTDIATIGLDDEPLFVDPLVDAAAGAYTYRVRSVRAGADGDVRSNLIDTETDTVDVEGDPAPTTATPTSNARRSTLGSRSTGGRATIPRWSTGARRSTTPTTLDTGFEDSLDYGEGSPRRPDGFEGDGSEGDDPLAGQSIVRDESEGMGLAVPAAGALVMLGWAGHIVYLNRLAKQL